MAFGSSTHFMLIYINTYNYLLKIYSCNEIVIFTIITIILMKPKSYLIFMTLNRLLICSYQNVIMFDTFEYKT